MDLIEEVYEAYMEAFRKQGTSIRECLLVALAVADQVREKQFEFPCPVCGTPQRVMLTLRQPTPNKVG